jgi:hypothetical protein
VTERETLLAEIAEKQARLAEIDAEPDYEAWRPALEAYYFSLWSQPLTIRNFPSSWAKDVIRGLIAARPKAPPMGECPPRWPSEDELWEMVSDAWTDRAAWTADRFLARIRAYRILGEQP